MKTKLAKWINVYFHPLSVFIWATAMFLLFFPIEKEFRIYSALFILCLFITNAIGVFFVFFFRKLGLIKSFFRQDAKDKVSTSLIFAIVFLIFLTLMGKAMRFSSIYELLIMIVISLILLSIASYFWNICIYLYFWGIFICICLYYFPLYHSSYLAGLTGGLLFVSGVIASARIQMKFQTLAQTSIGFAAGLFVGLSSLLYLCG